MADVAEHIQVPGTELLVDGASFPRPLFGRSSTLLLMANLSPVSKSLNISHAGSGKSDIVLIPQPTDCGRDPLVSYSTMNMHHQHSSARVDLLSDMAEVEEVLSALLGSTLRLCLLLWREHPWWYVVIPLVHSLVAQLTKESAAAWTTVSEETGVSLTNMNGGSALNYLLLVCHGKTRPPAVDKLSSD